MRYHALIKVLAILLCACALLCMAVSALGVILVAEAGLYDGTPEQLQQKRMEGNLYMLAYSLGVQHMAKNFSNCPEDFIEHYLALNVPSELTGDWGYSIEDDTGKLVEGAPEAVPVGQSYQFVVSPSYPVIVESGSDDSIFYRDRGKEPTDATAPAGAAQPTIATQYVGQDQHRREYVGWKDESGVEHYYTLNYYGGTVYLVTLYLSEGAYEWTDSQEWVWVELVYTYRFYLPVILAASLVVLIVGAVYLACAAARKPGREALDPGGLNRLPLDVYLAVAGAGILLLVAGAADLSQWNLDYFENGTAGQMLLWAVVGVMGFVASLLVIGVYFAAAAQLKMPGYYWWYQSMVGKVLRWGWKLCKLTVGFLGKFLRGVAVCLRLFYDRLPLTWQWLLTAFGMFCLLAMAMMFRNMGFLFFALLVCLGVVLYGVYAFGTLMKGAKQMSGGDLLTKVNDTYLAGCFREFAGDLNTLANVADKAAKQQMKSERMKAELVTNVSHDIKTPLTSLINYVDLLRRAETEEEAERYLEVLDRQSQRLKKLIEDLMEMSRASTGNMAVELTPVDAAEAINQALGEFADKLDACKLTPVFRMPQEPISMMADGRLAWRVLSNLLSNAVKYALPGTRLYVDLVQLEGKVLISLKNISREELGINAEELMERFVRGDASRNTEGSGLGLNIAQSLMELQKGKLQVLVDGDLFKVTLIFPAV